MGWELLVDSDRDMGVFICTTADESFGPLIKMHYCDAEGFYKWWNAHIGSDPRSMDSNERSDALSRFYGVQYDIKFVITAPDGTEISGDSSSMNYCRVKGLYDKGWTKEQFDLWDCNGWEKIMASIMQSRECDRDGMGGPLTGFLFSPPSWASETESAGPKWTITAINNGNERRYSTTWDTWDWYNDKGEVIHTGDYAPDDIRTKSET
jgi:hypothetical protein